MTNLKLDKRLVHDLATLLDENDLSEIEISDNGQSIRIAKNNSAVKTVGANFETTIPNERKENEPKALPSNLEGAVTSPMVGTVYLAPEPGEPPFVQQGDIINAGDTLLIIEAMKVMNTIEAPRAGTVKAVLVDDTQPVEFGEPLLVLM